MATVYYAVKTKSGKRAIAREDLLAKHGKPKVGRWCKPPQKPDRCYFCPLANIRPAVGYVTIGGWRHGYCSRHKSKAYASRRR